MPSRCLDDVRSSSSLLLPSAEATLDAAEDEGLRSAPAVGPNRRSPAFPLHAGSLDPHWAEPEGRCELIGEMKIATSEYAMTGDVRATRRC